MLLCEVTLAEVPFFCFIDVLDFLSSGNGRDSVDLTVDVEGTVSRGEMLLWFHRHSQRNRLRSHGEEGVPRG